MAPRRTSAALGMKGLRLSRGSRILLGLDRDAARYTWTAVLVLVLVGLLYLIRETLFIFVVALLFAYLLWPLVKLLDRWLPGRSRVPALTLVYLAIVGILIVMGITLGSRVVQEANALAARLPDLLARFQPPIAPAASHYVLPLKMTVISTVQQQLASHSRDILAWLSNAALGVISRAGNLIFFILVPILSFFFLKDGREMLNSAVGILAAGARRDMVERIAADLHVLLAQYMRALVLLGVVASLSLWTLLLDGRRSVWDSVGGCRFSSGVYSHGGSSGRSHHRLARCRLERLPPPARDLRVPSRVPIFAGLCGVTAVAQHRHEATSFAGYLRSPGGRLDRRYRRLLSFGSGARYFANRLPAVVNQGTTDGGSA